MRKYDPFKRFDAITNENFLSIRIDYLKNPSRPESFNRAIDALLNAKNSLAIIQKIGRLQESGNHVYYIQALQWLKGETALGTWVSVPQININEQLTDEIAVQFEAYTTNLLSNLRAETLYSQVEVTAAVVVSSTSQKIKDDIAKSIKEVEAEANDVADLAIKKVQDVEPALKANIQAEIDSGIKNISENVQTGISQLQQAQALDDWGLTYEKAIQDLEVKLFGRSSPQHLLYRNFCSLFTLLKRIKISKDVKLMNLVRLPWLVLSFMVRNLATWLSWLRSYFVSYKTQRMVWFGLLVIFAILFVGISIAALANIKQVLGYNISGLTGSQGGVAYIKLTLYLPIAVILGIAYSFSVKNFRIYSNMLDQYKHRRLVAQTSQGVILSLKGSNNEDIRNSITAAAAQALFEHRTTGHLTKREAESMSPLDILRVLGGSRS